MGKRTLPELRRAVDALGGTVTENAGHGFDIEIEAPEGKVWACDSLHFLVCSSYDPRDRSAVLADAFERIGHGLEDCTVTDCEVCGDAGRAPGAGEVGNG